MTGTGLTQLYHIFVSSVQPDVTWFA